MDKFVDDEVPTWFMIYCFIVVGCSAVLEQWHEEFRVLLEAKLNASPALCVLLSALHFLRANRPKELPL